MSVTRAGSPLSLSQSSASAGAAAAVEVVEHSSPLSPGRCRAGAKATTSQPQALAAGARGVSLPAARRGAARRVSMSGGESRCPVRALPCASTAASLIGPKASPTTLHADGSDARRAKAAPADTVTACVPPTCSWARSGRRVTSTEAASAGGVAERASESPLLLCPPSDVTSDSSSAIETAATDGKCGW